MASKSKPHRDSNVIQFLDVLRRRMGSTSPAGGGTTIEFELAKSDIGPQATRLPYSRYIWLSVVGSTADLLAAGFIDEQTELPRRSQGCIARERDDGREKVSMLKDGRLRVLLDAATAAKRDRDFKVFLASITPPSESSNG